MEHLVVATKAGVTVDDDMRAESGLHEDAGPGLSAETRAMVHRDTDAMLDRVAELVARV